MVVSDKPLLLENHGCNGNFFLIHCHILFACLYLLLHSTVPYLLFFKQLTSVDCVGSGVHICSVFYQSNPTTYISLSLLSQKRGNPFGFQVHRFQAEKPFNLWLFSNSTAWEATLRVLCSVRVEMAKLSVPMIHRLRFSCGKEPQDAYLRDLRALGMFQREGITTPHLGSRTLLWEKVDQTCSWKMCFLSTICARSSCWFVSSHSQGFG